MHYMTALSNTSMTQMDTFLGKKQRKQRVRFNQQAFRDSLSDRNLY